MWEISFANFLFENIKGIVDLKGGNIRHMQKNKIISKLFELWTSSIDRIFLMCNEIFVVFCTGATTPNIFPFCSSDTRRLYVHFWRN